MENMDNFKANDAETSQEVSAPGIQERKCNYVSVQFGLDHSGNYVWNYRSESPLKPFPNNISSFVAIAQKYLGPIVPEEKMEVYPPNPHWDVKVITFKAVGVGKTWQFDEELYSKDAEIIGHEMSDLLLKIFPPRSI
jgi:hypothetical protein